MKNLSHLFSFVNKGDSDKHIKPVITQKAGELSLPELAYKSSDLGELLSTQTLEAHMSLHKQYVDKTRELVQGTDLAGKELDDVVRIVSNSPDTLLYQNAAQAFNHAFYWQSISPPKQDTSPKGALLTAINDTFGSMDACRESMINSAEQLFGSGYLWLARKLDKPTILVTKNAGTPLSEDNIYPLLCLDLWEHSYYLDYMTDRNSYIDSAVRQLLNWGFASKNWDDFDSSF